MYLKVLLEFEKNPQLPIEKYQLKNFEDLRRILRQLHYKLAHIFLQTDLPNKRQLSTRPGQVQS